ncbi:hypothetical protein [Nocardia sp. NPDC048505]|uniref:hypothetical protein n=1 Tax=unclassified Nocardia TaxID=2637762 RepID=UPI00340A90A1
MITTESQTHDGLLLHWRQDPDRAWFGLVVYLDNGALTREFAPAHQLSPRPLPRSA